ncbi:hypothetical protein R1flu_000389 [Riccia fluitans]|uniref:Uncharacterized protein n=1 Tax=Riccia fluitans TaxID=41844 RepID=A0ABD1Y190_9MARC
MEGSCLGRSSQEHNEPTMAGGQWGSSRRFKNLDNFHFPTDNVPVVVPFAEDVMGVFSRRSELEQWLSQVEDSTPPTVDLQLFNQEEFSMHVHHLVFLLVDPQHLLMLLISIIGVFMISHSGVVIVLKGLNVDCNQIECLRMVDAEKRPDML